MNARLVFVAAVVLAGCSKKEEPKAPADPCPDIALEKLAGDWIQVKGDKSDPTNRFRITGTFPNYEAVLIPGDLGKYPLKGEVRNEKGDVLFDEVLSTEQDEKFKAGARWKARLQVEPNKKKCSLRVGVITLSLTDGKESEKRRPPGYEEYIPFPKDKASEFTYDACTGPLFLGPAAKSQKEQAKQLKANNGQPDASFTHAQSVPVGVSTLAADDGDPSCSYDMDLFFDDRALKDKTKIAAGKVEGEYRSWLVPDWYAPYTGPHHFEMYRYRTCADGKRTRIGVQCLLAVLD